MSFLETLFGGGSYRPPQGTAPSTGSQPSSPPPPQATTPPPAAPTPVEDEDGDMQDGTYGSVPPDTSDSAPQSQPAEEIAAPAQPSEPVTEEPIATLPDAPETAAPAPITLPDAEVNPAPVPALTPVPVPTLVATAPRPVRPEPLPASDAPAVEETGVTDHLSPFLAGLDEIRSRHENTPAGSTDMSRQRAIASLQEQTAKRLIDTMSQKDDPADARLLDPAEKSDARVSLTNRWYAEA